MKKLFLFIFIIINYYSLSNNVINIKSSLDSLIKTNNPNNRIDESKPYFIFFTLLGACTSCCINSIKSTINELEKNKVYKNILVIIESKIPKDAFVFKRTFKKVFLCEDNSEFVRNNFKPVSLSEFYLVDQSGNILYKKEDIQHHPVDFNDINIFINNEPKFIRSINIVENDSVFISTVLKPNINNEKNIIEFIEPLEGVILEFSLTTGIFTKIIDKPLYLEFYYQNDSTNYEAWDLLKSNNASYIKILDKVRYGDEYLYLLKLLKDMRREPDENGKKIYSVKQGYLVCKLINDKFLPFLEINDSLIYSERFFNYSDNTILTPLYYFDKDYSKNIDTMFLFSLINLNDGKIHTIVEHYKINIPTNDFFIDYIDSDNNGIIFFISLNSNKMIFINSDGTTIDLIPPLEIKEIFNGNDSLYKIFDLKFCSDSFLLSIYSIKENVLNILSYKSSGVFNKKITIRLNDDNLLGSKIVDLVDNQLILFNKWQKKRWTLDFYYNK